MKTYPTHEGKSLNVCLCQLHWRCCQRRKYYEIFPINVMQYLSFGGTCKALRWHSAPMKLKSEWMRK